MHTKKHLRWLRRSGQLDALKPYPVDADRVIHYGVGLVSGVQSHNKTPHKVNGWERSVPKEYKKPT